MKRFGTAEWNGGLKEGKGVVSTESNTLNQTPYSFLARFEHGVGTNPEELIATAHAGCFSMAFSAQLEKAGFHATSIKTKATVTLEKAEGDGFAIPFIHLDVKANIPQITEDDFHKIALEAKEGCPVSKLMNAEITMDAWLQD